MRYLFVDTGAWLALELRNDQHHQDAKAFAQGQGRQYQWLTTKGTSASLVLTSCPI